MVPIKSGRVQKFSGDRCAAIAYVFRYPVMDLEPGPSHLIEEWVAGISTLLGLSLAFDTIEVSTKVG